ncbi:MAG: XdhC family protein [SAR324 cluster bacterium]|jgi:xanthine dehydrogenase accessory factor|nr:XdhC family protein [SAR324 cluster bacterium]MDP7629939.1 XdhC family protein [SAR324 cluster bacterium]
MMRDIWQDVTEWTKAGKLFAIARVVQTWRSAPRSAGAGMLVDEAMCVSGSVSGGCIEGAVIEEALEVLQSGTPRKLTYGVEDELALSVGLSCGGQVSVFVEPHWAFAEDSGTQVVWDALQQCLRDNEPAVLLTRMSGQGPRHLLVRPENSTAGDWGMAQKEAERLAREAYDQREPEVVELAGGEVFVQVFPRRDQLLIIGAGHITIPLVQYAAALDFETVVVDPRKVFASTERFPVAPDHLIPEWPQEALARRSLNEDTYALLLTHDPKIDDPALLLLLKSPVRYIGALGSRRTHAKRCGRLREAGFDEAAISRIKGPAGLDIGAESPAEMALSMIAEAIAAKRGKLAQDA